MRRTNKVEIENFEIDIFAILYELLNKIWIVILCTVIMASAAFAYSNFFIEKEYVSTAKLYILTKTDSGNSPSYDDFIKSEMLVGDYEQLIKSRYVVGNTISELNIDMSIEKLANSINVWCEDETRVLSVSVTTDDPELSQNITNKLCEIAGKRIVDIMRIDAVNVVDEATFNDTPSSPDLKENTLLGAFIGAAIACVGIVLKLLFDNTILTPDDVESYLSLSVLGVIPYDDGNERSRTGKHSKGKKK